MKKTDGVDGLSVSSSSPRVVCHYLLEKQAPPEEIEHILEDSLDVLESADFRLPLRNYHALWAYAVSFTGQKDIGLSIGKRVNEDEIGLVGHIFFNNATIDAALRQYQRYFSITNEGMSLSIDIEKSQVKLRYLYDVSSAYCIQDIERTIAAGITRTKEILRQEIPLKYISFSHRKPSYAKSYDSIFNCPLKFSQPSCAIVFDKKYLAFRLPHRSSYLQMVLSKHLDTLLSTITRKSSVKHKVIALIEKRLSKDSVDAEKIASKLNMSRNTLYRRLQQEEVSFHSLVDDVRKHKAIAYLNDGQLALSQIAFLLGFSELSAFSRAFKRWTGQSPARYLEEQKTKSANF